MRDVNPKDFCDLGEWKDFRVPKECYIQIDMDAQRGADRAPGVSDSVRVQLAPRTGTMIGVS
jgi:hypothetical protein